MGLVTNETCPVHSTYCHALRLNQSLLAIMDRYRGTRVYIHARVYLPSNCHFKKKRKKKKKKRDFAYHDDILVDSSSRKDRQEHGRLPYYRRN